VNIPDARYAVGLMVTSVNLEFAVFVLESWLIKVKFPG
jgi:hypothetical protein